MTVTADTATDLADRLEFWHPTEDDALDEDYLDWGAVAPGSSADLRLRVKNLSGVYWATGVTVAPTPPPYDAAASAIAAQHVLSVDGGATFGAAAQVGDVAPGAISAPVVLRRVTPADEAPATGAFQLSAAVTAWVAA